MLGEHQAQVRVRDPPGGSQVATVHDRFNPGGGDGPGVGAARRLAVR